MPSVFVHARGVAAGDPASDEPGDNDPLTSLTFSYDGRLATRADVGLEAGLDAAFEPGKDVPLVFPESFPTGTRPNENAPTEAFSVLRSPRARRGPTHHRGASAVASAATPSAPASLNSRLSTASAPPKSHRLGFSFPFSVHASFESVSTVGDPKP
jgi:hypothetical protein